MESHVGQASDNEPPGFHWCRPAIICRYPMDIFSQAMNDMKYVMHKGGAADLNLYVSNLNNGGIIGCAS